MQTEAETAAILIWGFFAVLGLGVFLLLRLWIKKKRSTPLLFFLAQLLFLTLGLFEFLRLLEPNPEVSDVMLSESNSLMIGVAGVWWGLSMLCMYMGVFFLIKRNPISDSGKAGRS